MWRDSGSGELILEFGSITGSGSWNWDGIRKHLGKWEEKIWKHCAGIMRAGCRDGQGKMAWGKKIVCFSFVFSSLAGLYGMVCRHCGVIFLTFLFWTVLGRRARAVCCFSFVSLLFFFGYRMGFWCDLGKVHGSWYIG